MRLRYAGSAVARGFPIPGGSREPGFRGAWRGKQRRNGNACT